MKPRSCRLLAFVIVVFLACHFGHLIARDTSAQMCIKPKGACRTQDSCIEGCNCDDMICLNHCKELNCNNDIIPGPGCGVQYNPSLSCIALNPGCTATLLTFTGTSCPTDQNQQRQTVTGGTYCANPAPGTCVQLDIDGQGGICKCNTSQQCPPAVAPSAIWVQGNNIFWSGGGPRYAFRVEDLSDGTTSGHINLCRDYPSPTPIPLGPNFYNNDSCIDNFPNTSIAYNFQPGHEYLIWIHSVNSCAQYSASTSITYRKPTPTPTPTRTPTPIPLPPQCPGCLAQGSRYICKEIGDPDYLGFCVLQSRINEYVAPGSYYQCQDCVTPTLIPTRTPTQTPIPTIICPVPGQVISESITINMERTVLSWEGSASRFHVRIDDLSDGWGQDTYGTCAQFRGSTDPNVAGARRTGDVCYDFYGGSSINFYRFRLDRAYRVWIHGAIGSQLGDWPNCPHLSAAGEAYFYPTPTNTPTLTPTNAPSVTPDMTLSVTPSHTITKTPTKTMTPSPTVSITPSKSPSPTRTPTTTKTPSPTLTPTLTPTQQTTRNVCMVQECVPATRSSFKDPIIRGPFMNAAIFNRYKDSVQEYTRPFAIVPSSGNWNRTPSFYVINTDSARLVTLRYLLECWDESACRSYESSVTLGPKYIIELGLDDPCSKWQLDTWWTLDGVQKSHGAIVEKPESCSCVVYACQQVDGLGESECTHDAQCRPPIQPSSYEIDQQVVSVDQDAVDPDVKYVTLALTVDNVSEENIEDVQIYANAQDVPQGVLVDIVDVVATDNLVVNQMSDGNTLLVDSRSSLASNGSLTGSEGGLLVTLKVDSHGKPNFTLETTTVGRSRETKKRVSRKTRVAIKADPTRYSRSPSTDKKRMKTPAQPNEIKGLPLVIPTSLPTTVLPLPQ